MIRTILAATVLALAAARSAAQPTTVVPILSVAPAPHATTIRDVSDDLRSIIERRKVPGIAAVAIRGGDVVMSGVAGVRRAGDDAKVTLNDRWHLGSCTKSMTATLCAMLVEEGTLSWDSTLADVFPDLAPAMHESWRAVTLTQLLSHRSGAPADLTKDGLWADLWRSNEDPANQRLTLLRRVTASAPVSPPGTAYLYSNAGVAIAGAMAERVAGEPWEVMIRDRLFTPLGITTAGFGSPGLPGVLSEPRGHRAGAVPAEPGHDADNPAAIAPAGRVHMTITDWAKYVALHLRGDRENPNRAARLVSEASFDRMHTPPAGDYALGWAVTTRPWGGRVLTHSGSNTMWYCVAWVAPGKDFAVLACANIGGDAGAQVCDDAAALMIRALTEK